MAVIVFTGGGTGGHIYPGLAVIEAIRQKSPSTVVYWIGSGKESEKQAVEAEGIPYFCVSSGKLRRNFSLRNFTDIFRVIAGIGESRRLLRNLKADLLFSKGGYVSVTPCIAASQLGIPVITHESDVSPGLATRINTHFADRLIVSWERTLDLLKPRLRDRTIVLGNPIRSAITKGNPERGREFLEMDSSKPMLLVLGGSQGADQINRLVEEAAPALLSKINIAHQTGPGKRTSIPDSPRYRQFQYITKEMADVLSASDIILCRAGAGTLWECTAAGKPMVLVPLCGSGTRGDQVENTRLLEDREAAYGFVGDAAKAEAVAQKILFLAEHPTEGRRMASNAQAMLKIDAAQKSADFCLDLLNKGGLNEHS